MLTINLQQIVEEINGRRNRIRYQFQELGMMLATKLGDLGHRSLYMKLAKYEEQELLMDAMHYVLASPNVTSSNLGALFMWKLKELKARPILPVAMRYEVEGGYFKIGMISNITRGDMPLLVAGITDFTESLPTKEVRISEITEKLVSVEQNPYLELPKKLTDLLKEFKRKCSIVLFEKWQWNGIRALSSTEALQGVLKLGVPVLTKRFPTGRMPTS